MWEIKRLYYGTPELEECLLENWQPFAITNEETNDCKMDIIWLKRERHFESGIGRGLGEI